MKTLTEETRLCYRCLEEHVVRTLEVQETIEFKGEAVTSSVGDE